MKPLIESVNFHGLEALRLTHGGEPLLGDFHVAFYVIAAVALIATILFAFLPKTAGQHLTRHGRALEVVAK